MCKKTAEGGRERDERGANFFMLRDSFLFFNEISFIIIIIIINIIESKKKVFTPLVFFNPYSSPTYTFIFLFNPLLLLAPPFRYSQTSGVVGLGYRIIL